MALDLNDEKAIDYSSELPFLPYEAVGNYVLDIVAYEHNAEAYNGAIDILTVVIKESGNASVKVGDKYVFVFNQHATGKKKAFAAAHVRQFIAAAMGKENTASYDANADRKTLLETDLSGGDNLVRFVRREKPGKGENKDRKFADDRWIAA